MPPREASSDRLERTRDPFLAALRVGASMADASRTVGVPERTVQNWISRGGREPDGPFGAFAAAVQAAREQVPSGPMDLDELREVVAKAARAGSVAAMKLGLELVRMGSEDAEKPAGADILAAVDELAAARRAKQADGA